MKKVILLRHGESENNILKLNNSDPNIIYHLTERGKQQAQVAAETLKKEEIDLIYSSEIARAKETAKIVNQFHNVNLIVDLRLNDTKTGFEGRPYEVCEKALLDSKDYLNERFNDGESYTEMIERSQEFLKEILEKDFKCLLIVSHGDPLNSMIGYLEKVSYDEIFKVGILKNCEHRLFGIENEE